MPGKKNPSKVDARSDLRKRTARGEETRRRIVEASIECLNRLGYAGTSIETVMEQSGMSRGSVLNQFPTRLALMTSTIETAMQMMVTDVYQRAEAIEDAVARLRGICEVYWQTQNLPAGTALTEILLAARWDEALALALRPVAERMESEIDKYAVDLSRAAGVPEKYHDASLVHARFIVLSLRGLTLELMYDPDRSVIHKAREHINRLHQAYCDRILQLS